MNKKKEAFDAVANEDINLIYVDDMVNHPSHYMGKNGMEAIDVIKEFTSHLSGVEAVDTGNILKYAMRWKKKNGIEDLKKIRWYVNDLINELEKENV